MPTGKKGASTTTKRASTPSTRTGTGSSKRAGNGHASSHMLANLEEGFVAELSNMLYAERELLKVLPKLAHSASSGRLRDALEWHTEQTEEQVTRLESVFKYFGHKPGTEVCEGMQGILAECKDLLQKTGQGPVRDAMIIAATQKAEHYEIAAYGTLCSWADQLREDPAVRLLEETLYEKKATDRNLTRIAESLSNPDAERGEGHYGREAREGSRFVDQRRFGRQEDDWQAREFGEHARMRAEPPYDEHARGRSGREKRYSE